MKALITGASSGLGKDFAFKLSNMGYDLILVSRNKKELEKVANNVKSKVQIEILDLSSKENYTDNLEEFNCKGTILIKVSNHKIEQTYDTYDSISKKLNELE